MTPDEEKLVRNCALAICAGKYSTLPCDEPCDQCWADALRLFHRAQTQTKTPTKDSPP